MGNLVINLKVVKEDNLTDQVKAIINNMIKKCLMIGLDRKLKIIKCMTIIGENFIKIVRKIKKDGNETEKGGKVVLMMLLIIMILIRDLDHHLLLAQVLNGKDLET